MVKIKSRKLRLFIKTIVTVYVIFNTQGMDFETSNRSDRAFVLT